MARGGGGRRGPPQSSGGGGGWSWPWPDSGVRCSQRLSSSWHLLDADSPGRRTLDSSSSLEEGEISAGGVVFVPAWNEQRRFESVSDFKGVRSSPNGILAHYKKILENRGGVNGPDAVSPCTPSAARQAASGSWSEAAGSKPVGNDFCTPNVCQNAKTCCLAMAGPVVSTELLGQEEEHVCLVSISPPACEGVVAEGDGSALESSRLTPPAARMAAAALMGVATEVGSAFSLDDPNQVTAGVRQLSVSSPGRVVADLPHGLHYVNDCKGTGNAAVGNCASSGSSRDVPNQLDLPSIPSPCSMGAKVVHEVAQMVTAGVRQLSVSSPGSMVIPEACVVADLPHGPACVMDGNDASNAAVGDCTSCGSSHDVPNQLDLSMVGVLQLPSSPSPCSLGAQVEHVVAHLHDAGNAAPSGVGVPLQAPPDGVLTERAASNAAPSGLDPDGVLSGGSTEAGSASVQPVVCSASAVLHGGAPVTCKSGGDLLQMAEPGHAHQGSCAHGDGVEHPGGLAHPAGINVGNVLPHSCDSEVQMARPDASQRCPVLEGSGTAINLNKGVWARPPVVPLPMRADFGAEAVVNNIVQLDLAAVGSNLQRFENALVGRLFGRKFPFFFLNSELQKRWDRFGKFKLVSINADCFICFFDNSAARDAILSGGPWMISGQVLGLDRWTPSFSPTSANGLVTPIWVRMPGLPFYCWDSNNIARITSYIGDPLWIDVATDRIERGSFARACVRLDLSKPLKNGAWIQGLQGQFFQPFEYEGISSLCFRCGCVGHKAHLCGDSVNSLEARRSSPKSRVGKEPASHAASEGSIGAVHMPPPLQVAVESEAEVDTRGVGPWVLVARRQRRGRGPKGPIHRLSSPCALRRPGERAAPGVAGGNHVATKTMGSTAYSDGDLRAHPTFGRVTASFGAGTSTGCDKEKELARDGGGDASPLWP